MKTLEELKRENAEAEAKSTEAPQTEEEETEVAAVEEETEESSEVAEPGDGETEETETEAWMQSDEQASQDGAEKTFTGSDIAAAKRNLRAKLGRIHNSEVEELRKEIEALKSRGAQQQTVDVPKRPRLEDFDHDEDAHQEALDRWYEQKMEAKIQQATSSQQQTVQQRQAAENFNRAIDQHYERAAKLAQEANITAEVYQNADLAVRSAIEQAMPKRGDLVTEQLISVLGEGSEKVMYYLGRNKSELAALQSALLEDPTGMKATLHLGKISSRINNPQKQTSRAPKPAKQIKGDEGTGIPASAKALKKKYDAAAKSGDAQARFDARRAAKQAGVDVSNW